MSYLICDSRIIVHDSRKRPLSLIQPVIDALNKAFARYRKKSKIHRPFWRDFTVDEAKYILKQPPGNDHCGFYVMHYMQCYSGDCRSSVEMNGESRTSELLIGELIALQEQLAA